MIRQLILFGIILTLLYSCSVDNSDKRVKQPFIKSYELIHGECRQNIIDIMKPYNLEDSIYKLDNVYQLEILNDTAIYSDSFIKEFFFIGFTYHSDSLPLEVFCINKEMGTISFCQPMDNVNLIIYNMNQLFCNLETLSSCNIFDFEKELITYSANRKNIFRLTAMTTNIYGSWERLNSEKKDYHNPVDNGIWQFKRENELLVVSEKGDTLLFDNFELHGSKLNLKNSKCPYSILSLTQKAIIFQENNTNNSLIFYRKK